MRSPSTTGWVAPTRHNQRKFSFSKKQRPSAAKKLMNESFLKSRISRSEFVYFARLCIKASLYSSDNQCPFSTDHGPALLSEAGCICVAHILVGQSHSHGTACMSSKKKKSVKIVNVIREVFTPQKKKKSTKSSLLSPPAQCLDKDLQITAEL